MKEWYSIPELAEAKLPDLPTSLRGIHIVAHRMNWQANPNKFRKVARRGGGFEYHYSLLPTMAQAVLARRQAIEDDKTASRAARRKALWQRFEAMTDEHREICRRRLFVLDAAEKALQLRHLITDRVITIEDTLKSVCREHGISMSTYYEWTNIVREHEREDWLAALAPQFAEDGVVHEVAPCHPDAWEYLKADYLRPEKPAFSACFRRMMQIAKARDWSPIPSERSLRRRMETQVPKAAQILARKGKKAAMALYPAQVRSKSHLHAMQITNTDGHKLDLFVQVPWQKEPARVILMAIQDVYSGKILSWRLCEAETWDVVRAIVGDMVEDYGIPEHLYMDNGRAFASKKISGGARNRNRFKVTQDEVNGLLVTLGITPHFTKPYSGQSKPIERAWRDLAEEICKHPAMAGCYTGNKPDAKPENYRTRAVPLEDLRVHVAERIAEHNGRPGRKSLTANGRSFDQTFADSMALPSTIVRWPTNEQRSLWMLSAESVMASKPSGAIHFQKNIYWASALNEWIGKKLTIRFDPEKLHEPVKVYDPRGRFICDAECRDVSGFESLVDARTQAKAAAELFKANKKKLDAEVNYDVLKANAMLQTGRKKQERPDPIRPTVTRLVTGNLAQAVPLDAISEEQAETSFTRAMSHVFGGGAVIPFPEGNTQQPKSSEYGPAKKKGGRNPAQ